MAKLRGLLAALALSFACDAPNRLAPPPAVNAPTGESVDQERHEFPNAAASGGGHYSLFGLDVQFGFTTVSLPDGRASGRFHVTADEGGGLLIDFSAHVTCLAVDPVNHRAWIGGVITKNASTDPDLLTDIQQPGHDIWFRVLDAGEGASATDRTTFTGFEGSAGIQTSAQYCAARLWPADNARTWPVTGNVSVRP
jgi:hypothetical protein